MNLEKPKPKRLIQTAAVLVVLMWIITGCSLSQSEGEMESDTADQILPSKTFTSTPKDSPTITPTPTITNTPGPSLTPTQRPTWTPFPTKTLRPTWTPSPTLSPTATSEIGWILEDDFTSDDSIWLEKKASNWATGLARKAYFMQVSAPNVEITSSKSWLKLTDVRIEADVYKLTGKGYYGFSCWESSSGAYYTIFVTSDGHFGFGNTRGGRVEFIYYGYAPDVIPTGNEEVFRLRGECRGNTLAIYVNDVLLHRHELLAGGLGLTGMMVGTTTENDHITVYFDNIKIWGPYQGGQ